MVVFTGIRVRDKKGAKTFSNKHVHYESLTSGYIMDAVHCELFTVCPSESPTLWAPSQILISWFFKALSPDLLYSSRAKSDAWFIIYV